MKFIFTVFFGMRIPKYGLFISTFPHEILDHWLRPVQVSRGIYPWWRMRSARERARWRAISTKWESPAI
jgi:hypothetical protein